MVSRARVLHTHTCASRCTRHTHTRNFRTHMTHTNAERERERETGLDWIVYELYIIHIRHIRRAPVHRAPGYTYSGTQRHTRCCLGRGDGYAAMLFYLCVRVCVYTRVRVRVNILEIYSVHVRPRLLELTAHVCIVRIVWMHVNVSVLSWPDQRLSWLSVSISISLSLRNFICVCGCLCLVCLSGVSSVTLILLCLRCVCDDSSIEYSIEECVFYIAFVCMLVCENVGACWGSHKHSFVHCALCVCCGSLRRRRRRSCVVSPLWHEHGMRSPAWKTRVYVCPSWSWHGTLYVQIYFILFALRICLMCLYTYVFRYILHRNCIYIHIYLFVFMFTNAGGLDGVDCRCLDGWRNVGGALDNGTQTIGRMLKHRLELNLSLFLTETLNVILDQEYWQIRLIESPTKITVWTCFLHLVQSNNPFGRKRIRILSHMYIKQLGKPMLMSCFVNISKQEVLILLTKIAKERSGPLAVSYAPAHSAPKWSGQGFVWELLTHPPYSLNLVPFWLSRLFSSISQALG